MTPEEQRKLAIECSAVVDIKHHTNVDGDSIVFLPNELADYTAAVEAKERERCAKELDLSTSNVLLMAGEMTRLELSAVMAVVKGIGSKIRGLK